MQIPELVPENIEVVGPRTLLEMHKQAGETSGGLIMSKGEGSARPSIGMVLKKGTTSTYEVGQILMFRRYAADIITIDTPDGEKEVCLLEDIEVLATVSAVVEAPPRQGKYNQITEKQNASKETARSLKVEVESSGKKGRKKDN